MTKTDYDVVIVGGGMVGASLACALEKLPIKVAVIEAQATSSQQASYDDRAIALAYGSQLIFQSIGLWPKLSPYKTPILNIHISDRGYFGVTRLSAVEENVPALGQVIIAREVGKVLNESMSQQTNLDLFNPHHVTELTQQQDTVSLLLNSGQEITTKLVVAADGTHSTVRQLLNIEALTHDYQQTAIIANVSTERPHNNCAFERFTDSGPLALLPMSDNRCSLVWSVNTGDETVLVNASDDEFLAQLQDRFGYRLGHFTRVGQRASYPLSRTHLESSVHPRIAMIGNAAHTLHPIAGQGFNLGLRDVMALASLLAENSDDCGQSVVLEAYQQGRQSDQKSIIAMTDRLVTVFSQANPLLGHARGASLSLLDVLPFAKHCLAKKSMGLTDQTLYSTQENHL